MSKILSWLHTFFLSDPKRFVLIGFVLFTSSNILKLLLPSLDKLWYSSYLYVPLHGILVWSFVLIVSISLLVNLINDNEEKRYKKVVFYLMILSLSQFLFLFFIDVNIHAHENDLLAHMCKIFFVLHIIRTSFLIIFIASFLLLIIKYRKGYSKNNIGIDEWKYFAINLLLTIVLILLADFFRANGDNPPQHYKNIAKIIKTKSAKAKYAKNSFIRVTSSDSGIGQ